METPGHLNYLIFDQRIVPPVRRPFIVLRIRAVSFFREKKVAIWGVVSEADERLIKSRLPLPR
jgi:hypothetical protein